MPSNRASSIASFLLKTYPRPRPCRSRRSDGPIRAHAAARRGAGSSMSDIPAKAAEPEAEKGSWGEIFRDGLGLYSALVIGGIAMHATQMLVIAIIMPTIVADIGGAAYYTWAAMLYTIGAIVGASSTGVIWGRIGPRRGYALGAAVFALGTIACALAPNIGALIAARAVQGWAGGLVAGSGMALITGLFDARLRTRIIAMSQ